MRRREFLLANLGAAIGGTLLSGIPTGRAHAAAASVTSKPIAPGVKLGMRLPPRLSQEDLEFMRQLNLGWCRLDLNPEDAGEEAVRATVADYAKGGVGVFSATCRFGRNEENGLTTEALDRKIADESEFIRVLGRVGIPNYEISFNRHTPKSQVYSTGTGEMRGLTVRRFDLEKFRETDFKPERPISAEEVIKGFDYTMERVLPVAEEAGVRIAIHPDDPPIDSIGGVARIFHHVDHFDRAFKRHASPNLGILLCVGTWAEGGEAMGATVPEAVRHFAAQDKLFSIHFRNVDAPLPIFHETFMDNGYVNMQEVMDALVEVDFNGLLVPDHIPHFDLEEDRAVSTDGKYQSPFRPTGVAYSAGVMNAYLQTAMRKHGKA